MEPHTICIYHGNCADGFGAAWVVREFFKRQQSIDDLVGEDLLIDFFAGFYQMPPPDVTGKDVIIVDFSYKRPVIEEMLKTCRKMVIIDHHASAIADLQGLDLLKYPHLQFVFDTNHSGAMLAWMYFFSDGVHVETPPMLLRHIEDRDLWRFAIPGTREIQANLFSYPYDFDVWDMLMDSGNDELANMERQGEAIERKHFKDIAELLAVVQRRGIIGGFDVPIANLPYTLSSDAGHQMNKGEPFAACWMETKEGFVFSLRSRFGEEGETLAVDVSKIAVAYGGGGHKAAAGFKLNKDDIRLKEIFTNPVLLPPITNSLRDPYLQTR